MPRAAPPESARPIDGREFVIEEWSLVFGLWSLVLVTKRYELRSTKFKVQSSKFQNSNCGQHHNLRSFAGRVEKGVCIRFNLRFRQTLLNLRPGLFKRWQDSSRKGRSKSRD